MNERTGFPQKKSVTPGVKNSNKYAKKKSVPSSANWESGKEGDWGIKK